ncbi:hypothetical protein NDU88_001205 [Pleurodeles waltl]|uniref:Uncharacterized protein n=1 Tax=Pleurodeles waltl TaxID=8319 RepID=A0AAV7NDJ8_PLEWA|nr:hypothetical protein NDU88_001205 [Pleurodeles waltl]
MVGGSAVPAGDGAGEQCSRSGVLSPAVGWGGAEETAGALTCGAPGGVTSGGQTMLAGFNPVGLRAGDKTGCTQEGLQAIAHTDLYAHVPQPMEEQENPILGDIPLPSIPLPLTPYLELPLTEEVADAISTL